MHKCPNCGNEYEGKFCPDCGEQWQDNKTCPVCGAKLSGETRFCPECGYSFYNRGARNDYNGVANTGSTIAIWAKSHLKLIIALALAIVLIIVLAVSIPSCIAAQDNGTYYKLEKGEINNKSYFTLKSGKWSDNDGATGTYKKDGEKITFYMEFFGETTDMCSGTVADGVLKIIVGGEVDSVYISEKHKHNFGEWKTTTEVSCLFDGEQTRTCDCGVKEKEPIKAVGHHTGSWVTTKEATCTETGSRYINCTACNQTIEEIIDIIPHNVIYVFDNDAHWQKCSMCDKEFSEKENHELNCKTCGYPLYLEKQGDYYSVTGVIDGITEVIIPESFNNVPITSIADNAFKNRNLITSVTIPDSVTEIGIYAFYGCKLKSINYTGDIASWCAISGLGNLMSYGTDNKSLFIDGKEITGTLIIPDSVTSINSSAFYECSGLTSFTIPDSVTSIGSYAFYGTAWYNNQPEGLVYAGKVAYVYKGTMPDNTSITLADGTKGITNYAFSGCSSLTNITIPDSVTSIGEETFKGCNIVYATIPTYAISYIPKSTLITVTITSGTSICKNAFRGCSRLTEITIPDSVTSIGEGAFEDCYSLTTVNWNATACTNASRSHIFDACENITTVNIGENVTTIPNNMFYDCNGLTSITIPNSITSIGNCAFSFCTSLVTINWNATACTNADRYMIFYACDNITTVNIGENVTTIPNNAFVGCSGLTSITIPDSVTSIGEGVFDCCTELTYINYNGTIAQWKAIVKGNFWKDNTGEYTVHCTDGDLSKSES